MLNAQCWGTTLNVQCWAHDARRRMLADAHGFEGDFDFDVRFFDGTVDSEVQFVP